jgi:hypothetical protein
VKSPTTAPIYFEVDGKPQPATNCHWIEIATCGCIAAIHVAAYEVRGELTVHNTAEDAFFSDLPKVVREYEQSLGRTYRLITHQQYRDTYMDQMKGSCPHTPQWGEVPVPVPDGWSWKCSDSVVRRTHRKHIVPDEMPQGGRTQVAALCGKKEYDFAWRGDEWHDLAHKVPCKKCVKRADETSPALPGVLDMKTGEQ